MNHKKMTHYAGCVLGIALLAGAVPAFAAGAAAPATQPAATQSSAEAAALLGRVDAAYAKLQSAQFNGHVIGQFDVGGEKKTQDLPFTSSFRSPNRFRHETKGDVLVGSTGQKVYAYQPDHNAYLSVDAPKERGALSDWPRAVAGILEQQNPSLLLALTKSAAGELKDLAPDVTRLADTNLDGTAFATLRFELPSDHQVITMLVDPQTSLLRQVKFDLRKSLEARGAVDVKTAEVTVDYTQVATDTPLDEAKFAWTPPAGATLVSAKAQEPVMADDEDGAAKALVGKPAPDFTLPGLDDKPVKLSAMKGSVVVLDFWATWCGPCVASLPHLDQLYKEQSPKGLKVYAVNLQEEKDAVKAFVEKKKWTLPVLLDSQGEVAKQYGADAIPETVIVGKDGVVKKVFIGAGPDTEEQIKAAVAKEMGV
jgi:peroxiredoxin/outer membrane lipoprotein-sorting protein